VRWRRTARSDLLDLARWIAQDNPTAAHRPLDAARAAADMLAEIAEARSRGSVP
jgi:plasmid stabilization system protein ParE